MKQKRTFIAVLLVIAVLALGIAYALQDVTLEVKGTAAATANDANFKIGITAMTQDGQVVNADSTDGLTPSITVTTADFGDNGVSTVAFTAQNFSTKDDAVTAKVTVKNSSTTLAASLAAVSIEDDPAAFTVTKTGYVKGQAAAADTVVLQPGEIATFTVTIKLDATPLSNVPAQDVTLQFIATPQAPQA